MSLDLNNVSTKVQLDLIGQQTTELLQGLCFLSFQGLCFQTQFQNVGKYSSDVTATKFLYLEDES